MDAEDFEPRVAAPPVKALGPLSVGELEAYIAHLESEIVRARDAIAAKCGVRADAEALFGRKA